MLLGSFASVQYILLQMNKMIPPVTGPYRWDSSTGHLCFFLQNKLPGNSAIYPDKDQLLFLRRIKCKIRNHCSDIPIHYLILIIPRCLSFIYHERRIREFFFLVCLPILPLNQNSFLSKLVFFKTPNFCMKYDIHFTFTLLIIICDCFTSLNITFFIPSLTTLVLSFILSSDSVSFFIILSFLLSDFCIILVTSLIIPIKYVFLSCSDLFPSSNTSL